MFLYMTLKGDQLSGALGIVKIREFFRMLGILFLIGWYKCLRHAYPVPFDNVRPSTGSGYTLILGDQSFTKEF